VETCRALRSGLDWLNRGSAAYPYHDSHRARELKPQGAIVRPPPGASRAAPVVDLAPHSVRGLVAAKLGGR
jgi:hypothetical protein